MDRGEADDEVLGIITRDEALERAREEGVDLVMIAEKSDPPVFDHPTNQSWASGFGEETHLHSSP